jgi:heme oxygenase
MSQSPTGHHGHPNSERSHQGRQENGDFIPDATGGMLVDEGSSLGRPLQLLSRRDHGARQGGRFFQRHGGATGQLR